MEDKNLELLEQASVPKAILKLSLPTVLSTVVSLLYNLTDTYFIGLLDDPVQLGAISLAFPVFLVIQADGGGEAGRLCLGVHRGFGHAGHDAALFLLSTTGAASLGHQPGHYWAHGGVSGDSGGVQRGDDDAGDSLGAAAGGEPD